MQSLQSSLVRYQVKTPTTKAHRKWQDKDNPYSVPNIIKRYGIRPPQTHRLWKLAKENYGFIETTVKGLEDGMKQDLITDCCGTTEFDPWGYRREDGLWNEKCGKCGGETDVHYGTVYKDMAGVLISKLFPKV